MSIDKSVQRLNRVLEFYNKQLDLLKLQLAAQHSVVNQHQQEISQLTENLLQSQNRLQSVSSTIANRQMGYQFGSFTMAEIVEEQGRLELACQELENRKSALRKQISKIESLEKLIERRESAIAYEAGRREQVLADERYLNSKSLME